MAAVQQSADTIIELTQLIERGPEAPDGWMPSQALSSPAQTASRAPVISPLVANMIPGLTEKVGGLMDKFSFLEGNENADEYFDYIIKYYNSI